MAMREHSREALEPYEPPQTDYEWDYDEEPARHETPKVLWGRIAILGVFLIAAFLIGRMTAGSGIPASDLERASGGLSALGALQEARGPGGRALDHLDQLPALLTPLIEDLL